MMRSSRMPRFIAQALLQYGTTPPATSARTDVRRKISTARRLFFGRLKERLSRSTARLCATNLRSLVPRPQDRRRAARGTGDPPDQRRRRVPRRPSASWRTCARRVARQELADVEALLAALRDDLTAILRPCEQPLADRRRAQALRRSWSSASTARARPPPSASSRTRLLAEGRRSCSRPATPSAPRPRAAARSGPQRSGARDRLRSRPAPIPARSSSTRCSRRASRGIDVLIADTAGRLHSQSHLMEELKKVKRVIQRVDPTRTARGAAGAGREPGTERARAGGAVPRGRRRHGPGAHQARRHGARRHRLAIAKKLGSADPLHRHRRAGRGFRRVRRRGLRRRADRRRRRTAGTGGMIRFDRVAKRYPNGREALSGVSFEIAAGEMVFLTGRSGAGKSTVLKLIALLERPTRGQVIVNGQNTGAAAGAPHPGIPPRRSAWSSRTTSCCTTARIFDNVALPLIVAAHAAARNGQARARGARPGGPARQRSARCRSNSRSASSSASASPARWSPSRRC